MTNRWMRNSLVYLMIVIAVIAAIWYLSRSSLGGPTEVPITQLIEMARNNTSATPQMATSPTKLAKSRASPWLSC
jgi:hypothetical protein